MLFPCSPIRAILLPLQQPYSFVIIISIIIMIPSMITTIRTRNGFVVNSFAIVRQQHITTTRRQQQQQQQQQSIRSFFIGVATAPSSYGTQRFITSTTPLLQAQCHYSRNHAHHHHPSKLYCSSTSHQDNDTNHYDDTTDNDNDPFFVNIDYKTLGVKSDILVQRLQEQLHIVKPTSIQAASYDAITNSKNNIVIGAETGTGKTLAYLLPLFDDIIQRKQQQQQKSNSNDAFDIPTTTPYGYMYARALILVPNKELVQQVVTMASILSGGYERAMVFPKPIGENISKNDNKHNSDDDDNDESTTIVRLAVLPGGLKDVTTDFVPFRNAIRNNKDLPVDILISTPAAVGPLALSVKNNPFFMDIQTVVIDEADMLLDGGYIRPVQDVFMGFKRADRTIQNYRRDVETVRDEENDDDDDSVDPDDTWLPTVSMKQRTQYIFVAATLPDYGLRSVDAYLQKKFPSIQRITASTMHNAQHYGLNQPTIWYDITGKQSRMKFLVENLLRTELRNEKIMIFLNSVDDVEQATEALSRVDGGIRPLPYHAKMSLPDRTQSLDEFRKYHPSTNENDNDTDNDNNEQVVLVCTDLASRGLDIPGVTTVVQLQFATNVVAHLHRMGRCGRAGKRTGRGIIFYDSTIEGELVDIVQRAENNQQRMILSQDIPEDEFNNTTTNDSVTTTATTTKPTTTNNRDSMMLSDAGKVGEAFSRKRGFTKKRKKLRRQNNESKQEI